MKTFEYYINLDERGSFHADVRLEVEGYDHPLSKYEIQTIEDLQGLIEDGYMKHKKDLVGLKQFLVDLEVMDETDELILGQ